MLILESARVKLEVDSGETAAEPPRLYTSTTDLPQPAGLPTIKTEPESNSESTYASSECSGEFLANDSLAMENKEQWKHCFVRIKSDPVVELMCNLYLHSEKVHTGEKSYSCYLTSLLRHEGSHADRIGTFRCRVCKKLLVSRKRLIDHARYHIWQPNRPVKKGGVKRLDCFVNLTRVHANSD